MTDLEKELLTALRDTYGDLTQLVIGFRKPYVDALIERVDAAERGRGERSGAVSDQRKPKRFYNDAEQRHIHELMNHRIQQAVEAFTEVSQLLHDAGHYARQLDTPENFEFTNLFRIGGHGLDEMAERFEQQLRGYLPKGADNGRSRMSADNYYVVKKHPAGGFTYVMGFACDENPDLSVRPDHPRFDTLPSCLLAVQKEYAEYGYSIDDDVIAEAEKALGRAGDPTEGSE